MRPISRWRHMMSSVVTLERRLKTDGDGNPEYDAPVPYAAHIARSRTLLRGAMGQEVDSQQAVYLATTDLVQPEDRITLSTGDVGSTEERAIHPAILRVEPRFDGAGVNHVVVYME